MENYYSAISIDALRDFRNVFSNAFLRDSKDKLIAYTHSKVDNNILSTTISPSKNIVVVYDCNPSVENDGIIFEFPGDGWVYISKMVGNIEINFSCKCEANLNARENICDKIYEKFGITIIL